MTVRARRTYTAGTYALGAVTESMVGTLVMEVKNAGAATVTVQGRVSGTGGDYYSLKLTKRADDTVVANATADGIYTCDVSGMDVQLVVAGGPADIGYAFIAG